MSVLLVLAAAAAIQLSPDQLKAEMNDGLAAQSYEFILTKQTVSSASGQRRAWACKAAPEAGSAAAELKKALLKDTWFLTTQGAYEANGKSWLYKLTDKDRQFIQSRIIDLEDDASRYGLECQARR